MLKNHDPGNRRSDPSPIQGDHSSIFQEQLLSLTAAARILPRRRAGRPTHVGTLYRWAQRGLKGHVLETIQIGGTRCTSVEALERFFLALSQGKAVIGKFSLHADEKRRRNIEEELDRAGI